MATIAAPHKQVFAIGPGRVILYLLILLGLGSAIYRWMYGLGASSALSDGRSWGIWISFDLLIGVALSAGAFVTAAAVHVFNIKKLEPILRPAILTGFLGYLLAILALLVDLGLPLRIWHLIIHWNIHAPMFEVGWCVMLYSIVLALEFSPALFERFGWKVPLRTVRSISVPLIITGIVLSTLHQSSLGTLWVEIPYRVHPLWYSPMVPLDFLVSAIAAGMAMVIVESNLSASAYGFRFETRILATMARFIPYVLGLYLLMKAAELIFFGSFQALLEGGWPAVMYLVELGLGAALPLYLFSRKQVRSSRRAMVWSAVLVLLGLILNRFNTSLTFFDGAPYLPSWTELAISAGYVALGVAIFDLAARHLPVFNGHEAH